MHGSPAPGAGPWLQLHPLACRCPSSKKVGSGFLGGGCQPSASLGAGSWPVVWGTWSSLAGWSWYGQPLSYSGVRAVGWGPGNVTGQTLSPLGTGWRWTGAGVSRVGGWTSEEEGGCAAIERRPAGCPSKGIHVAEGGPRVCHQLLGLGLGVDASSGGGEGKTLVLEGCI